MTMTPEQIVDALTPVLDRVIAERMEQVYATIEELRGEVREAVQVVADTATVLHDNDTALMGRFMEQQGSAPGEFVRLAGESWARFVRQECAALGWRVVVPKARD